MAYIAVPDGAPGIRGLLAAYPQTAQHIGGLTETLMCGPSSLSKAERELIGAYVSSRNECVYCTRSHASTARHLMGANRGVVDEVLAGNLTGLDARMEALLTIAEKVRRGGREVTAEDVARAREAGADDQAIHDTVLITATFCLFNRYVEGLGTWVPDDDQFYEAVGEFRSAHGYAAKPE